MNTNNVTTVRELLERIADVVKNARYYQPRKDATIYQITAKSSNQFYYLQPPTNVGARSIAISVDHKDVSINNDKFFELKKIEIL